MPTTLSRSLLTVLIPGLVGMAPWLLMIVQYTPATLGFDKNVVLANALIFALVAVVGSVFEGIGTHFEVDWDKRLEASHSVRKNWWRYLRYCKESEPVAFRYISRLVTTLYFELSMLFAAPIFAIGAALLATFRFGHLWVFSAIGLIAAQCAFLYFWFQAAGTHEGLCGVRQEINLKDDGQPEFVVPPDVFRKEKSAEVPSSRQTIWHGCVLGSLIGPVLVLALSDVYSEPSLRSAEILGTAAIESAFVGGLLVYFRFWTSYSKASIAVLVAVLAILFSILVGTVWSS